MYLKVQVSTLNLSINVVKLKEPWTEENLKAIKIIFHPNLLYSCCHFPKELVDYFTKRINSVKEK